MANENFTINVSDEFLEDLSARLKNTRWTNGRESLQWEYGTNKAYLKDFVSYWIEEYDWKKQEKQFNSYPQFKCNVDGVDIHFFHIKGKGKNPIPIILTHGWPDSFIRYQKIIPILTDPTRFGRNSNDSFDVVIPSVPGFGFSTLPDSKGVNNSDIADLWKKLMTKNLGYEKFGALGGDVGSGVTRYLAYKYPEHLIGIHLTDAGIIRDIVFSTNNENLSTEEIQYKQSALKWISMEGAYMSIQSTKPQTLSYGLSDSPVGLSAWILEKFYSWSDCNGNLEKRFSKDELLNNIMIYWLTNSIGTSNHLYYENTHSLPKIGKIIVPTGLALFSKDVLIPPKKWVESNLNVVHWTDIPEGGHFTAMEVPDLFADDVIKFYHNFRANLLSIA
jgi:microsomal epoxide hydrolase